MNKLNTSSTPTIERPKPSLERSFPTSKPKPRLSSAATALACFLVINIVLATTQPIQFNKFEFPYKGWAWWLMKDLRADQSKHNIAFLGSSLTVSSLNSADATHYKESLDLTLYHKTRYFDELLEEKTGGEFNTFNFSIPGQMPSDALLSVQAMAKIGVKPKVIVYGIAPRDFIDSELAGPKDTEPFTYLSRVVDIAPIENQIYTNPLDKLNRNLEKNIYLYTNAIDLQMAGGEAYTSLIDKFVPEPNKSQKPFTYWDRVKLLPEYKKGEFHPYANMCNPTDLSKANEYIDNSVEYIYRYKKPNAAAFETQMYFLKELAKYCQYKKISLILVNMPLTQDNMKLLKKEHYDKYYNRVQTFTSGSDVVFYDFNDQKTFIKDDFHDGVHMNARGGIKFIKLLTDKMAASKDLKSILSQSRVKGSNQSK